VCHQVVAWGKVAERFVRSQLVVASNPFCGHLAHLAQGFEHIAVEHFGPVAAVETLDVAILHGLAGLDEAQLDALTLRPSCQRLADELGAVVIGAQHPRFAADRDQLVQSAHDAGSRQVRVDLDP
jgi:hypothetical protein